MDENFESHKGKMEKYLSETSDNASKIRGLLTTLQAQANQTNQTNPPQDI